jgi:DNA repair photolyase
MVREIRTFTVPCRSVLTKSKIPSIDYALNPYLGCQHGCVYCYATFMARFHHVPGEWGSYVGVKVDAPKVLGREVGRVKPGVVSLGTVCDAYQPIEARTRLSRSCLTAFEGREGWEVGVLTKSDLVVRDADVLGRLPSAGVGFTITCLDPGLARVFEPGAPSPARRLAAMRELADQGIPVWGFFGPVLPTLSDSEEAIEEVLREMDRAGAGRILVDRLNLYPRAESGVRRVIARDFPDRLAAFRAIKADQGRYEAELIDRVERVARRLGVEADVCF